MPKIWIATSCITVAILISCSSGVPAAKVASTSKDTTARDVVDPDFKVDIYVPEKVCEGTTLLSDNHNLERPRIIEINLAGEIVWQYMIPQEMRRYTNPGFDCELLPNNHILYVLPGMGVFEIDREGRTLWSYRDTKVSHDADRLPNGNTLVVFGNNDTKDDAQVREVTSEGKTVWSWYAKNVFDIPPYNTINLQGWTHTNAAERLADGNTLISMRNLNLVAIVDQEGKLVRTYGGGVVQNPHDPQMLPNKNILMAGHPMLSAIEFDGASGSVVWRFTERQWGIPHQQARDANRLSNGNTLIVGTSKIIEVTPEGEIVWRFGLERPYDTKEEASARGFYKAQRIPPR